MKNLISIITGRLAKPMPIRHIVLFALIVRILFSIVFLATTESRNYSPLEGETYSHAGSDGIVQTGHNWLSGGTYSLRPDGPEIAFRPPIPVFLSGICAVISTQHWYLFYIVLNCVFGALLIYPCRAILREVKVPDGALTNLALLFVALHPYMVFSAKTLTAINLLAFLAASSTALYLRAIRGGTVPAMWLGFVLGAGILSHGSFMLLPLACAIGLVTLGVFRKITIPAAITRSLIVVAAALLVASPWTLRNYQKFHMFIPTVSGAGLQFWITEDVVAGTFTGGPYTYEKVSADYQRKTGKTMTIMHGGVLDPRQDAELAKWGKELLAKDPLHFLKRFGFGIFGFWAPLDQGIRKASVVGLLNLPLLLATLTLTGFALVRRSYDWNAAAILGVFSYIWFVFAAVQAISSYFVMIIPLVILHGFHVLHLLRSKRLTVATPTSEIR